VEKERIGDGEKSENFIERILDKRASKKKTLGRREGRKNSVINLGIRSLQSMSFITDDEIDESILEEMTVIAESFIGRNENLGSRMRSETGKLLSDFVLAGIDERVDDK
jgi:hypothetical protein